MTSGACGASLPHSVPGLERRHSQLCKESSPRCSEDDDDEDDDDEDEDDEDEDDEDEEEDDRRRHCPPGESLASSYGAKMHDTG